MSQVRVYKVEGRRYSRSGRRYRTYEIRTRARVGAQGGSLSKQRQVQITNYARTSHAMRYGGAALYAVGVPYAGVPYHAVHTAFARSDLRKLANGNDVAVYKTVHKTTRRGLKRTKTRKTFKTRSARTFGKSAFRNRNVPPKLTTAQRQQMARRRRRVKGRFA